MLPEIHEALRRLLHERGGLDPATVEVRFDAPTRELTERLTRPAISLFLTGASENTDLRGGGPAPARAAANGQATRRMPPRRIDLRYLVSAITTEPDDEHRLLWRALATLLRWPQLPTELLPAGTLAPDPPITARVAQPDDANNTHELWSGLGVPPRPAFPYILTVPLDLEIEISAPLVLTRETRYLRSGGQQPDAYLTIGGTVRDAEGAPLAGVSVSVPGSALAALSDDAGRWRLVNVPRGELTLRASHPDGRSSETTVQAPGDGYDLTVGQRSRKGR